MRGGGARACELKGSPCDILDEHQLQHQKAIYRAPRAPSCLLISRLRVGTENSPVEKERKHVRRAWASRANTALQSEICNPGCEKAVRCAKLRIVVPCAAYHIYVPHDAYSCQARTASRCQSMHLTGAKHPWPMTSRVIDCDHETEHPKQ